MKQLLKYIRTFQMGFQSAVEYRADFTLSLFSGAFVVIIQCFIWSAVFSGNPSSVIYGYTFPQMISYSIISGIVTKWVSTGFEWDIAEDIKTGGLSKFIVQPIGYFSYRIFSFLGRKIVQSLILLVFSVFAMFFLRAFLGMEFDPVRLLLFFPFMFLAMTINFLLYFCVSTLAFSLTEVWGVFFAVNQAILMLSGGIFPLDIFGEQVTKVLNYLPFKYLVFYPVNIVNGRVAYGDILNGVVIQMIWIVVMIVLANLCWKSGMKKYVAVGG